jgi:hypothetical protein
MPAVANPLAPGVQIARDPSRLVVRFRPALAPRVLYAAFLSFFVAGALAGLVGVVSMLGSGRLEGPSATVAGMWLVALAAGLGFGAWAFFRAVLATEVVELGGGELAIRHVAGPLRPGASYALPGVRRLRHEVSPQGRRRGRRASFAFDHAGRTVRFGFGVDGKAAEEVLAALRERVRTD